MLSLKPIVRLFYTPWKHQKTIGFLMFSGGIERLVTWNGLNLVVIYHFSTNLDFPLMGPELGIHVFFDICVQNLLLLVIIKRGELNWKFTGNCKEKKVSWFTNKIHVQLHTIWLRPTLAGSPFRCPLPSPPRFPPQFWRIFPLSSDMNAFESNHVYFFPVLSPEGCHLPRIENCF